MKCSATLYKRDFPASALCLKHARGCAQLNETPQTNKGSRTNDQPSKLFTSRREEQTTSRLFANEGHGNILAPQNTAADVSSCANGALLGKSVSASPDRHQVQHYRVSPLQRDRHAASRRRFPCL